MLNTWGQLLVLALALSFFSMRYPKFPLAVIAMLAWLALWNYNLGTPPTGITVGSFGHDLLTYVFIIAAITVFLIYVGNRGRLPSGLNKTAREQAEYDKEYKEAMGGTPSSNLMELDTDDYRRYIRGRLRKHRRRR